MAAFQNGTPVTYRRTKYSDAQIKAFHLRTAAKFGNSVYNMAPLGFHNGNPAPFLPSTFMRILRSCRFPDSFGDLKVKFLYKQSPS